MIGCLHKMKKEIPKNKWMVFFLSSEWKIFARIKVRILGTSIICIIICTKPSGFSTSKKFSFLFLLDCNFHDFSGSLDRLFLEVQCQSQEATSEAVWWAKPCQWRDETVPKLPLAALPWSPPYLPGASYSCDHRSDVTLHTTVDMRHIIK